MRYLSEKRTNVKSEASSENLKDFINIIRKIRKHNGKKKVGVKEKGRERKKKDDQKN